MSERYIVAGGDMRFSALAEQLAESKRVCTLGFDKNLFTSTGIITAENVMSIPGRADCLILPLPVSTDGTTLNAPYYSGTISLSELPSCVKENGIVFGGRISPAAAKLFTSKGIEVIDYFEREELAVLNALVTAEGALQIALEEQPVIISGCKVLILGMGRIAKSLIRLLCGFGTHTAVSARKYSDLAWAEVYGCSSVSISDLEKSDILAEADIIFNTIPHMILNEQLLKKCSKSCLIIDLASKPGGMDMDAAGRLGLRAIWALSLPGKTAPVSSGRMIGKTIENILRERRYCSTN
ncbi:MAG: dipicolinate synthase subunit DpsA [Oscillospiraceae bacterium]|nr:dipicolinate synthase subunit DpsA [Oscillospiraceae bacterium]